MNAKPHQVTAARAEVGGVITVLVAVADVASAVARDSALDEHARHNTTSVYTAAAKFPMFPDRLSTDLTSLNYQEDRPAVVVEMGIAADGGLAGSHIYQAWVRSQPKLAYHTTGAWLEGTGPVPGPLAAVDGLEANLRLQDTAAQRLADYRRRQGALSLERPEAKAVFDGDRLHKLEAVGKNRAT
jgi:exoribonuclease-2